MTAIRPTKTRLALLQAVADGAVREHYPLRFGPKYSIWDLGPGGGGAHGGRYRKVTAAVKEQERAGWIRVGEQEYPGQHLSPRMWEITDAGRLILEAAE